MSKTTDNGTQYTGKHAGAATIDDVLLLLEKQEADALKIAKASAASAIAGQEANAAAHDDIKSIVSRIEAEVVCKPFIWRLLVSIVALLAVLFIVLLFGATVPVAFLIGLLGFFSTYIFVLEIRPLYKKKSSKEEDEAEEPEEDPKPKAKAPAKTTKAKPASSDDKAKSAPKSSGKTAK